MTQTPDTQPPDDKQDFVGLLRSPRVNPLLTGAPAPADRGLPEGAAGRDPAYVPVGEVLQPLSVRVPERVRALVKRNAMIRNMTQQEYVAMLIERDSSTS